MAAAANTSSSSGGGGGRKTPSVPMMTTPGPGAPGPGAPGPTATGADSSSRTAAGDGTKAARTAPAPPPAASRRPAPPAARTADPLSDKATVLLIRRTLCPQEAAAASAAAATTTTTTTATKNDGPWSSSSESPASLQALLLPPLTSRNDVDLQLYALVAIVVREFVLAWYSKISPDEQFVTELVQIVAHLTRALEQRLRRADLARLLLDELPALLDAHTLAYRAAYRAAMGQTVARPVVVDARAAYHALCPLPAMDAPEAAGRPGGPGGPGVSGDKDTPHEAAYRDLLVGGMLAVLLPTEDLQNGCLMAIVTQIVAELLIGGVVARRLAEPWMMWEMVGMVARLVREKLDGGETAAAKAAAARTKAKLARGTSKAQPERTGRGGNAPPPDDVQAGRPAPASPPTSSTSSPPPPPSPSPSPSPSATSPASSFSFSASSWLADTAVPLLWTVLRLGFALFALLRFLVASIGLARSLPSRLDKKDTAKIAPESPASSDDIPVLAYRVWPAAANLLELDVRMPWLYGALCMGQWLAMTGPGRIGALDGPLDRLLHHYIHTYALDPALLPGLLRSTRAAVFPGNKFGAPPTLVAPASEAEWAARRRKTAASVVALVQPQGAGQAPTDPSKEGLLADVEGALGVLDDAYCNKHLLYGVLEAILVRLVPELAETGVTELLEERLS